jgi:predicted esterase
MINTIDGFIHRFVPAQEQNHNLCLLLLHGTGGDETSMLSLGIELAPRAAMLSPRGKVLENGKNRFFCRTAEGVFDKDDLIFHTTELANFVREAKVAYHIEPTKILAIGYSNGANIAASMLLLHPEVLDGAVLFRPMVPLVPDEMPNLEGKSILIVAGRSDPLVSIDETERLVAILKNCGANVALNWHPGGHEIDKDEIDLIKRWIESTFPQ